MFGGRLMGGLFAFRDIVALRTGHVADTIFINVHGYKE